MRFGVFYEHQLARPWDEGSELRLIQDALEQVEHADRLGIDYVWEVEHHFLEEYSHSSAPEVFLAACSQRTHDIRLGHGIVQTAPQYNHPARTAERLAMLDLVSSGRVDFGSGESSSEAELGAFGIPYADKRAAWLEGLEVTLRCLTETPFSGHRGRFLDMPQRNVVPKPVQKPHPPLWVACSRKDTILLAAEKGIGALSFAFIDPEEARGWVTDYERTMAEQAVPVGQVVNPNVACVTSMMCHADEQVALDRGLEGANFFGYSLAHFYVFGEHRPGITNVWDEFQERRARQGFSPEAALAARQEVLGATAASGDETGLRGAIGTPAQLREFLRRYEEAGVDQVIFVMQAGKNRHEDIMESLELFAREVMPEFQEREPAHQKSKAARYAPIIDAAFARKDAAGSSVPPMPDDFVLKAIPKQMIELADAKSRDNGGRARGTGDTTAGEQMLERVADVRATGGDDELTRSLLS